jgi:hypothetical protein
MGAPTITMADPAARAGEVTAPVAPFGAGATLVARSPAPREKAPPEALGLFERVKRFFLGTSPAVLKEERVRVHWLSMAYMVVMSVFALQVFALSDFQTAFNPKAVLADRVQSALLVSVIVVAVFISDYAAPHARELAKLVALRGETGLAWSLRFYAVCVYGTDGYAVITILYRSVAHLPATTPPPAIGPLSGDWTEVLIRGMLIVFTGWMIHTVTQKQYPTSNTLARRGAEIMGGVLLNRLANQQAGHVATSTVAQWFRAFTEAAKRYPRFTFPRLPFMTDPAEAEKLQWDQLVAVIQTVEQHGASGVTAGSQEALAMAPSPALPPAQRRDLPPALSDDYFTFIAGIVATLLAQDPTSEPTPARIIAEAQRLGYVAPRQMDVEVALIRLAEDGRTPTIGMPSRDTAQGGGASETRALPDAASEAFVDLIDSARKAVTNRGVAPNAETIIAELTAQGYPRVTETAVARALVTLGTRIQRDAAFSTSAAAGNGQSGAKAAPRPGTKKFNALVYDTAKRLLGEDRMTIFNIAQEMQVDPQAVQDAIAALKQERISRLKPGKELEPDPVLDIL